jgi:hypothetical protein
MSLWTPSGEHPVDRPGRPAPDNTTPPRSGRTPPTAPPGAGPASHDDLSPEQRAEAEEFARQVDAARQQLLDAPAGPVVGQQALQFYELAALHLSQPEPRLDDARIAIDAFAAVVDALGPRLGDAERPLRQALNEIHLAFVEVSRRSGEAPAG